MNEGLKNKFNHFALGQGWPGLGKNEVKIKAKEVIDRLYPDVEDFEIFNISEIKTTKQIEDILSKALKDEPDIREIGFGNVVVDGPVLLKRITPKKLTQSKMSESKTIVDLLSTEAKETMITGKEEAVDALKNVAKRSGEKMVSDTISIDILKPVHKVDDPRDVIRVKEIIKSGNKSPLIVEFRDGKYFVVDGHHRLKAYKELGITEVPIVVNKSGQNALTQKRIPATFKSYVDDYIKENIFLHKDELSDLSFGTLKLERFFGINADIFPSQRQVSLSSVKFWEKKIKSGERPPVLIEAPIKGIKNVNSVVDGHSRLKAYHNLGIQDIPVIDRSGQIIL